MSKRHFFLYDFLLPIACILAIGKFLSDQFDTSVFMRLDKIRAFGFGAMFSHSALREMLWNYSWVVFAIAPALLWMIWVRINIEYDYVSRGRRLDRPLYGFVKSLMRWIDGDDGSRWVVQNLEFRIAQGEDRARRAEAELAKTRQDYARLERQFQDLDGELQDEYQHDSQPG